MQKVAIIDDGVNEELFSMASPMPNIEISSKLEVKTRDSYEPFLLSHGTYCAAIIHELEPEAKFASIKITNSKTKKSSIVQLVRALSWCVEHGLRLVNLSMGTVDYRDFSQIENAVSSFADKGLIVVAAYNNYNIYTCPASLPCVFGVKSCNKGLLSHNQFVLDDSVSSDGSNFIAQSCFDLCDCFGNVISTPCSNSFSAPVITAIVYNLLTEHPSLHFCDIKQELNAMALNIEFPVTRVHKAKLHDLVTMPVIAICHDNSRSSNDKGDNEDCSPLACDLENCLLEDGYNALLFSDDKIMNEKNPSVIPLQYAYSPEEKNITPKVLSTISYVYQPDIFIVCLNDSQNIQLANKMPFDVILHEMNDKQYIQYDKSAVMENEYFFINNKANKSKVEASTDRLFYSFESIYNKILNEFVIV